jgi:hypothetical protein
MAHEGRDEVRHQACLVKMSGEDRVQRVNWYVPLGARVKHSGCPHWSPVLAVVLGHVLKKTVAGQTQEAQNAHVYGFLPTLRQN